MATTKPDRLHFTGNDEADELIAREPLALLIGFVLDQQVPVQKAFSSPLELKRRLGGSLVAADIAGRDAGELEEIFRAKPALHRYPGTMAHRTQDLCAAIASESFPPARSRPTSYVRARRPPAAARATSG